MKLRYFIFHLTVVQFIVVMALYSIGLWSENVQFIATLVVIFFLTWMTVRIIQRAKHNAELKTLLKDIFYLKKK
jgi:hypothetical protein